ncbi:TNF receptor-associated factor 3-like isoform X2 [Dysidea avara]|uniref:TNF receptor-associated factor 3-like isoform X2 n=1 Tax=Dysidea avara TaxID=196820 RepID=UPI00331EB153
MHGCQVVGWQCGLMMYQCRAATLAGVAAHTQTFFCEKCHETVAFIDYFYDKAISKEIDHLMVSCPHCSNWTGEYHHYQNHIKEECQLVKVSCPNEGCHEEITRSQLDDHLQQCQYRRQSRKEEAYYDQQKEHEARCNGAPVKCLEGYNNAVSKREMDLHFDPNNQIGCTLAKGKINIQECLFASLGCQFLAGSLELEAHLERSVQHHLSLVSHFLLDESYQKPKSVTSKDYEAMKNLLHSEVDKANKQLETINDKHIEETSQITELESNQNNNSFRLTGVEDLLTSLQASVNEINHTYEEVSLTLQTLQATSYDGHYIWKIPDITRRRRDALLGKTVSLYSAPFYTSRFGYRLCLRVYLDGDGSGKGRYISYFLTIMKGEYDALLEWPFQHMVTMTLVNRKGNNNIVQSFRPNPTSTSFHRPKSDMNVASGCPKFAPLSILDNPEFVVDDVAFFKCNINVK